MTDSKAAADRPGSSDADSSTHEAAASGLRWAVPVLIAIGGLAGAAGSEVTYRAREWIQIEPERLGIPPHPPAIQREMLGYAIANHALGFGGLGLLVGGSLGLGLGACRGSAGAALRGLVVGGLLGMLLGAIGGVAAFQIDEALVYVTLDGLFKAMLIHLPNWLLLATALAITGAVVLKPRPAANQLFLETFGAGLLTAILYPLLALILFPTANSDRPIPLDLGPRVLCFAFGGMVLGLIAARWCRSSSRAQGAPARL